MANIEEEQIKKIFKESKTVAVVGASPKSWRDSGQAVDFLRARGYEVFPVNPNYTEVGGRKCFPNLQSIGREIDIVDVFRNPADLSPIVDESIAVKAKTLWLQLGVVNPGEQARAEAAGIVVIADRCIMVDYRFLMS
jgi:hypothetical protein